MLRMGLKQRLRPRRPGQKVSLWMRVQGPQGVVRAPGAIPEAVRNPRTGFPMCT